MPERLTPGVYVEEVSGGVKPIQGVGTSTAGFIGEAARGIPDRAEFITGFQEFERKFGGHRRGQEGFLAQAVESFFNSGGRRAYVVRVLPADARAGSSKALEARDRDAWGIRREVLLFEAKGNGTWADHIRIHIEPATSFKREAFRVRVEWTEAGRSRTVETFDNLRLDPSHEDYAAEVINENSRYINVTDLFARDFIDAEERTLPPLPETAAVLETLTPADGTFDVPQGVTLGFRWKDNTSSASGKGEVIFDNDTVIGAGGVFDQQNEAQLTPGQMRQLLAGALGDDFRVTGPAIPARLLSEEGPWDTTDGNQSNLTIDGAARQLVFEQTTAATITLDAFDYENLNEGDVIALTVNGEDQRYTLTAADMAAGAGTLAGLQAIMGREFTGIQVFPDGGNLVLRTDARGAQATLALSNANTADLGAIAPAQGSGNVDDPSAVTASELAAIFNQIPNNPFEARVDGARVQFVQIDFDAQHTIQWVDDPGPDTIVADTNAHAGPTAAESVQIRPAVATRAYLVIPTLAAGAPFDFNATNQIDITVTDGNTPQVFTIDVAADAALSPLALSARIQEALDAGENRYNLEVDNAGDFLVLTAKADRNGVAITAVEDAGAPWQLPRAIAGAAGTVVDSHNAVEISVSEEIQPGIPRVLSSLFNTVRATGLDQNSPANPGLRPEETEDQPARLSGGFDGTGAVSLTQYTGSVTSSGRNGMRAFDTVDVNMLVMPGKISPGFLSAAIAYCDTNDIFFIADGAGSNDRQFQMSADDVRQFVEGLPARSNNAAMFYPWIEVPDPVGVGRNPKRFVPPSGHVAGIFARTDLSRGVWKAPAGIEAVVSGAIDLQHALVDADQDLLNPIGLNCLRKFPNVGIVSWGSRTLSSDPEWRYVPVRRTALFLKESLRRGMKWAVFEPNNHELWDRIRSNITAFMLGLFRQGAFQGTTPDEAYRVKCDRETNPQELVDQGIVTARVAFAPLKPAEFVVIQISQKTLVA